MSSIAILDAITLLVSDCLDPCDYTIVRGQGASPLEGCNIISIYPMQSVLTNPGNKCNHVVEDRVVISVTRCCDTIDGAPQWDAAREELEALCQQQTVADLETCLECELVSALKGISLCPEDNAYLENVVWDSMRQGGCYSATLTVRFMRQRCCPIVP